MPENGAQRQRRMEEFTLDEVSFVTRPAQTPAISAIMKNDFSNVSDDDLLNDDIWKAIEEEVRKNGDYVHLATSSDNEHQHAISIHSTPRGPHVYVAMAASEGGQEHDHSIVVNPDGTLTVTENHGHTHEIDQTKFSALLAQMAMQSTEKASSDAQEAGSTGQPVGKKEKSEMTDAEKAALEKAQKDNETLKAQLDELTLVAKMSDAEKQFMDKLSAEKQAEFKNMSVEDRKRMMREMTKAEEDASEIVYKSMDGQEYHKSDDPRLVAMAKARDEDRKELAIEKAAREDARLEKAAETDLEYHPGSVEVRKAILKAVEGISNEETRKSALEALKAKNAKFAPAFETVGKSGGPSDEQISKKADAETKLDDLAKELQKADSKLSFVEAYTKACDSNPELANLAIAG